MNAYRHTVQYYETDRMGIVHHSNYIRWMEEARVDYLAQLGWGLERLEAMGSVSPATYLDAKYKQTTTFSGCDLHSGDLDAVYRGPTAASLCDDKGGGACGV